MFDADGAYQGQRASNRDITQRKDDEAARLALLAQNLQLKKSESLGRMAGAIAHLFNNHLAVIMGNLDLAGMARSRETGARALDEARDAAKRAADVSGLMLTYLGLQVEPRITISLSDVCHRAVAGLRGSVPADVEVRLDLRLPGPAVHVSVEQVQTVISNLLTNAWESYGGQPGLVGVSVTVTPAERLRRTWGFPSDWKPRQGSYAEVIVTDRGCGVPDEVRDRIFDPFFSTKFPGRGMGLAVAAGIVTAHDGAVRVDSSAAGSTFALVLPLAAN